MPALIVRDIHKHFQDGYGVLHGINLDIEKAQIACLLGPSGCGKTTLLRIIAGLETPDRGQVIFDGQDMLSVPVHKRGFGLMFQDFALFPHKDVAANVAFGLQMQNTSREKTKRRVQQVLHLVNLQHLAHRDIYQLSGGEQQRVALARSLAPQPKLLMLDEPMGALDRTLRDRLLEELQRILKHVGVTVLYVTHDQGEAFAIADQVIVMRQGQIVQIGTPEQVYRRPIDTWVAQFLGMQNLLPGKWQKAGWISTDIGLLQAQGCGQGPLTVLIRPEAAVLGHRRGGTPVHGTLVNRSFRGALIHLGMECPSGTQLAFDLPMDANIPAIGEPITLTLRSEGIVCLEQ